MTMPQRHVPIHIIKLYITIVYYSILWEKKNVVIASLFLGVSFFLFDIPPILNNNITLEIIKNIN